MKVNYIPASQQILLLKERRILVLNINRVQHLQMKFRIKLLWKREHVYNQTGHIAGFNKSAVIIKQEVFSQINGNCPHFPMNSWWYVLIYNCLQTLTCFNHISSIHTKNMDMKNMKNIDSYIHILVFISHCYKVIFIGFTKF